MKHVTVRDFPLPGKEDDNWTVYVLCERAGEFWHFEYEHVAHRFIQEECTGLLTFLYEPFELPYNGLHQHFYVS